MMKEIRGDGVEVMVSVWPTVTTVSENFPALSAAGMLVRTEAGGGAQGVSGLTSNFHNIGSEYDSTNPGWSLFHLQSLSLTCSLSLSPALSLSLTCRRQSLSLTCSLSLSRLGLGLEA